jgi:catechol 2,3-dioxygenase-like lactoylglutathione lyase family enzyme
VLRYFGIRVTNLECSLDFYCRLLGLKEVRERTIAYYGTLVLLQDRS